jgi:thiol-disulfide isomerase/thioredoxin
MKLSNSTPALLALLIAGTLAAYFLSRDGPSDSTQAAASDGAPQTTVKAGLEKAKAEGKPVMILFTGTEWCPPCQHLERTAIEKEAFQQFAADEVVFVKLDFPRNQSAAPQTHFEAAQKYRVRGFPTVVLLNEEGKELERFVGGRRDGVDGLIRWARQAIQADSST